MINTNGIIVTDIQPPMVVHSAKGRTLQMKKRSSFGLSLCSSGQITYTMNGQKFVSDPTNAVLLPQGGTYTLSGDKEGLFPLINFTCAGLDCREIHVFPLQNPAACHQDFETIQNLFLYNGGRLKLYSAFYELLDKVFSAAPPRHDPLQPVLHYMEEHLAEPELSNAALAEQLGISEVYLRKLFARHHGISPRQYLLELRIRKAKQLLADTTGSVTAVAETCGFSSLYHFCRVFKAKTGMTPTEYAARHKTYQI